MSAVPRKLRQPFLCQNEPCFKLPEDCVPPGRAGPGQFQPTGDTVLRAGYEMRRFPEGVVQCEAAASLNVNEDKGLHPEDKSNALVRAWSLRWWRWPAQPGRC